MKIGILTRNSNNLYDVSLNGVPNTYLNIIKEEGYPILIDSKLNIDKNLNELLLQIKDIDGFLLPGGDTISEVDLFIIDYCYKNDLPLLGICLGMQEIAYYFNKNTLNEIGNLSHFDMKEKYLHQIKLKKNGYLKNLIKSDSMYVNSRHKYHISENDNYTIEATSNNIIEAIKVKNKKYIVGLQFHPEIMYEYDNNAKIIFNDFFNTVNNYSKKI